MVKKLYIFFICVCLFFFYVWADKRQREGLQNYDASNLVVDYEMMYATLTNDASLVELTGTQPIKPFTATYFKSNLTDTNDYEDTKKDFAYFNNASAIFAGYKNYSVA